MAQLALTQVWRDLARNQEILPLDVHHELHDRYDQPKLPRLGDIMDEIDEAYQCGEKLRYGSARAPIFKPILPSLIETLNIEYSRHAV